jgi:hypothetical protein
MSNPTSNFNWQMPTATDLVTDLPADFEVFGQAVDTALMDLKGGTSGQVLAKNSNTDMDFVWVAQDDSNAIQNTIVDAKGDLIAATASDTPARLAIGTNGQVLTADSAEATGMKWATAAGGTSWTRVADGSLSGASVTVSSLSAANILVILSGFSATVDAPGRVRLNGDTNGNNYYQGANERFATGGLEIYGSVSASGTTGYGQVLITLANTASPHKPTFTNIYGNGYISSSTISSVTMFPSSGNWDAGTYEVWTM